MGRKKYNTRRLKSKTFNRNHPFSIYWLLPLFLVITVPLIVYGKYYDKPVLFEMTENNIDFFSYFKSIYFIIYTFAAFAVMLLLIYLRNIEFKMNKFIYIPIGVYLLLAVVSTIVADDTTVALQGYFQLFQGLFVLIAYMLIVVAVYNLINFESHIKLILTVIMSVTFVIALIGIGQYFGYDIFKYDFVINLLTSNELSSVSYRFDRETLYGTLVNTNYVGSFAALLFPLSLMLFFHATKPKEIVLNGLFVAAIIVLIFGSNSRAGIVGVAFGFILFLIFFGRHLVKTYKKVLISLAILLVIGVSLNHFSARFSNTLTSMNVFDEFTRVQSNDIVFEDVLIEGNNVEVKTSELNLTVVTNDDDDFFDFLGDDNTELDYTLTESQENEYTVSIVQFTDEAYEDFSVKVEEDSMYRFITVTMYRQNIYMLNAGNSMYIVNRNGDILDKVDKPARVEMFDDYEKMFSGRVFIWSRSIPKVFDNIIIGAGPDHYIYEFPNDDYMSDLNRMFVNTITDKPHNMFLQIGVNTGFISLLSLLFLFGYYIFDSSKLLIKHTYKNLIDYLGLGIFLGIVSYLVSGIFNDQVISVAPLFYLMLGLGFAVNKLLRDSKKKEAIAQG